MKRALTRWKNPWLLLLVLPVMGFGLAVGFAVWSINSGLPGNLDFYLHRSKYESTVAKAREQPLAPGAQTHTTVDGLKLDVGRNPSGSYTVTITSVDWHHAGVYGYVFSDLPATPHPNEHYPDFQSIDNPGDMPFLGTRIIGQGGHWSSVYNNLD